MWSTSQSQGTLKKKTENSIVSATFSHLKLPLYLSQGWMDPLRANQGRAVGATAYMKALKGKGEGIFRELKMLITELHKSISALCLHHMVLNNYGV